MPPLKNLKHEIKRSMSNKARQQEVTKSANQLLAPRDLKMIELRYLGTPSKTIAKVVQMNESHVRKLFMSGGRLEKSYQIYVEQQQKQSEQVAQQALQRAKEEALKAIERMIALSEDKEGGAVCYKANEYLLQLVGVTAEPSLRSIFGKLSYDEAVKKVHELFVDLYGKTPAGKSDFYFHVSAIPETAKPSLISEIDAALEVVQDE